MKILIAFLCALSAYAQTVTVAGNVVDAAGGNAVGMVTVSWPNFNYGGVAVTAGSKNYRPSAGAISVVVYPGTYTVTYRLTNGQVTTVKWIVPASPSSTSIAAVQTAFLAPNLPDPVPLNLGGTNSRLADFTASKCVQVSSDGLSLESSTDACGTSSIAAIVESGTSYTVDSDDKGKAVFFTSASTVSVTIPAASTITGSVILAAKGAGAVNLSGGFTVSLFTGDYVILVSDGTTWRNVNQVLRAGNGQSSSSSGAVTTYNLDALLYAIDQLAGNGFIAQTGGTTVANRTITGTANEVCVTNGDGVSGNPTLAVCATFDVSGKTSTKPMKTGTAAPGTCVVGEMFFDTDATAGQNLYGCTATNTWTLQAGGGDAFTANPLSQFASTTSAQLAGVLSNETGTSLAVFNTNPTLVTPLIQNYTVAGLPSAGTAGRIALVSNSSDGTCTSGGGSTWVFCRDTGSAWTAIAGGGTTYTAGAGITISGGTVINADDTNGKLVLANDGTTGTVLYETAVQNSSGNAVKGATTDTSKVLGVCASGCGTSGSATIVQRGQATLKSVGAVTRGQYVIISTGTAGAWDSTATCPTDKQVFGVWTETQGSAGNWGAVLQPGLCVPASSGGGINIKSTHRKYFDYCSEFAGDAGLHGFAAANSGGASNAHWPPASNARAGCGQTYTQTGASSGNYVYVETASARKWLIVNEKASTKLRAVMTPTTNSGQDLGYIWNTSSGADFTDTHDRIGFTQASSTSGGYSGYANTTAWHVEVCASAACSKTNTAVTVTSGRTYAFTFEVTGATTATWTIREWTDDGSVTETTGNLTSLTWFTSPVQPYAVVINRDGVANHGFRVHSAAIEWAF